MNGRGVLRVGGGYTTVGEKRDVAVGERRSVAGRG